MEIAAWIKQVREDAGLTIDEAATRLGVHRTSWYRWESGRYKPDAVYLMKIAKWANVSMDKLAELLA